MTPYLFEADNGHTLTRDFPMGEAPLTLVDPDLGVLRRSFASASLQFSYGKEDWHGPTLGERLEQQRVDHPTAEPVGQRWI